MPRIKREREASTTRHPTKFTGVFYRESAKRNHNNRPDRCFYYLLRVEGIGADGKKKSKLQEIKVGWASENYTAQDAERLRNEHLQRLRHGDAAPFIGKKELTFADAFDLYYELHAKPNKKSHKGDLSRFNHHLKNRIGHKRLAEITTEELQDIVREYSAPKDPREKQRLLAAWKKAKKSGKPWLSGSQVRQIIHTVSYVYERMLEWPSKSNYYGKNPAAGVKLPKPSPNRVRHLTKDEASVLLEKIRERSESVHNQCLLSLECGMRVGEVSKMCWKDIDFENAIVNLPDSKGGRSNEKVYLSTRSLEMLKSLEKSAPADLVFPAKNGGVRDQMSDSFNHAVDDLGFNKGITSNSEKVVPHTLRHTYASWLAMSGRVDVFQLQKIMRHRSIQTTMKYVHLMPEHASRKAANIIDEIVS